MKKLITLAVMSVVLLPAVSSAHTACEAGDKFNILTGAPCFQAQSSSVCQQGDLFNILTGQRCVTQVSAQTTESVVVSPDINNPVAATKSNTQNIPILIFNSLSSKNTLIPSQVSVSISNSGYGSVTTAYLYLDYATNPIVSTVVTGNNIVFDIPQNIMNTISWNTKHNFSISVDVSGYPTLSASLSNVSFVSSNGNTINATGNVNGNIIKVVPPPAAPTSIGDCHMRDGSTVIIYDSNQMYTYQRLGGDCSYGG